MNRVVLILVAAIAAVAGIALFMYSESQPAPNTAAPYPTASASPAPAATAVSRAPVAPPPDRSATRAPAPAASPKPEAPPTTGTLTLESDTPETTVFLDRKFLGTAPQTVSDVAPGEHQLIFSPTGQDSIRMTIDVAPGPRTITARFKELRLDEKVDVVHKHTFGSCSGTLAATPEGLTYRTSNTGDAFTTPLTSLDSFAMDVVEKNLRVKIKGGKTYNFTDPGGTPDKLYMFHQAVEKARQRLLSGRRP